MKPEKWLLALALGALGCGGSSYAYESPPSPPAEQYARGTTTASAEYAPSAGGEADYEVMAAEDSGGGFGGDDWDSDYNFESEGEPAGASAGAMSDMLEEARPQMANNMPPPQQQAQQAQPEAEPAESTDGVDLSGPLLIYTARFHLGVYEVTQTQDAILEQLGELDVILARRSDTELVVRVPAARFQQAVDQVEGAGDVLHREVNAQDVGEEFRDIAIRLRNAEVMRERLERLLQRADAVEDALAIERELQRLTDIIERFKGRQRYLSDQIRFSTITIVFQALSTEPTGPDGFTLPFDWLGELGLSNLMRLR